MAEAAGAEVLLCMAVHLRSALLSACGLAVVGLSVPLSYVVLVLLKAGGGANLQTGTDLARAQSGPRVGGQALLSLARRAHSPIQGP